ncbi:MAG: Gfo/Idh/MocA family oxidoreductase [Lentisphaeria bacterium]|nr:Gfo/Idh/MocA family oxidoreductase [Lentisphaeria bacterium]
MKKRVVIAGTGTRALNFAEGLLHRVNEYSELVGLFDINMSRIKGFQYLIKAEIPGFIDFEEMLRTVKPDTLLVCVPDYLHPEFVEKGFAAGLDVVTEKPMAMDRAGIERIRNAERKYNKEVIVTFNVRFQPYAAAIKKLLMEKPVGNINNVVAEWFIDRTHGQEYFHRWHANMKNGGGLLVHKATHHFDLLNWFLEDEPVSVYANGSRKVFGDANDFRGERCSICPHRNSCWAVMRSRLDDADLNPGSDGEIFDQLFFKAEHEDGYIRDNCCFRKDIDIYDTMSVIINYKKGTVVNYSENAYSPWQGYNIVFNGDNGRIEVGTVSPATRPPETKEKDDEIRIIRGTTRENVSMEVIPFKAVLTPHGGGDYALFDQIFGAGGADPLGQRAGSRAGALSALIGISANESILSGQVEKINF